MSREVEVVSVLLVKVKVKVKVKVVSMLVIKVSMFFVRNFTIIFFIKIIFLLDFEFF